MHVEMAPVSPGFESLRHLEGQNMRGHNILHVLHSYIHLKCLIVSRDIPVFLYILLCVYVDMLLVSYMSNVFTILDAWVHSVSKYK